MMTLMGQMGQPQDYARGIAMLKVAAEQADENAPQGAYVSLLPIARNERLMIAGFGYVTDPRATSSSNTRCPVTIR